MQLSSKRLAKIKAEGWIDIAEKLPPYGRFIAALNMLDIGGSPNVRILERKRGDDDEYDAQRYEYNIGSFDDPFFVTLKNSKILFWKPVPINPLDLSYDEDEKSEEK